TAVSSPSDSLQQRVSRKTEPLTAFPGSCHGICLRTCRVSGGPVAAPGNVVLSWDSSVVNMYTEPTGGTALEQFIKPFSGFNGTNLYVEDIATDTSFSKAIA
ncbi:MAG: hypothetical protein LBN38_08465, partial [Verrucomicrobiota bacterium]|nr:hypothetical protein [Verrucomicrobiota bacterium]